MKYLSLIIALFFVYASNTQEPLNVYHPTIMDSEMTQDDRAFATNKVNISSEIHNLIKNHANQFASNGQIHQTLDKTDSSINVVVTNYSNLKNVLKWERLEMGIELPTDLHLRVENFVDDIVAPDNLNPFLDWEIRVFAELTHPDLLDPIEIDGFYMRDYLPIMPKSLPDPANRIGYSDSEYESIGAWEHSPTPYNFRVRFAPSQIGEWRCKVHIVTATQDIESDEFTFNVIAGTNEGYVHAGDNGRFLKIGTNNFFPVGCNAPWPLSYVEFDPEFSAKNTPWWDPTLEGMTEGHRPNYARPRVYETYRNVIGNMADQGVNMVRTIMFPSTTEIEWERLGNYSSRLHMAYEMDKILELAERKKIYYLWDMQIHFVYQQGKNAYSHRWTWDDKINGGMFCYRELLGTGDTLAFAFLSHAESKKYYKQRIRYILSRYGYSTNIGLFELFSEITNIGAPEADNNNFYSSGTNWEVYRDWQQEMAEYMKTHHNGRMHLITSSYAGEKVVQDDVFTSAGFDVMSTNIYDFGEPSHGKFWIKQVAKRHLNEQHGQNASENSYTAIEGSYSMRNIKPLIYSEMGPILNRECKNVYSEYNRMVWQGSFSGLAMVLPWDAWRKTGNYKFFGQIASFMNDIELDNDNWHPGASRLDNGQSPPRWEYDENYAKRMIGSSQKADLAYLRSGDKKFAIGVITNNTYNVYTISDCFDSTWNFNISEAVRPEARWSIPFSESQEVSARSESLKLKGMQSGKYIIEYYYPNDLINPIGSSSNNGPNVRLDHPIGTTDSTYLILFKARRSKENWKPAQ
jgi:hypothetical protein